MINNNDVLNIREIQERKEIEELSPYAAKSAFSKRRGKLEQECPL